MNRVTRGFWLGAFVFCLFAILYYFSAAGEVKSAMQASQVATEVLVLIGLPIGIARCVEGMSTPPK